MALVLHNIFSETQLIRLMLEDISEAGNSSNDAFFQKHCNI